MSINSLTTSKLYCYTVRRSTFSLTCSYCISCLFFFLSLRLVFFANWTLPENSVCDSETFQVKIRNSNEINGNWSLIGFLAKFTELWCFDYTTNYRNLPITNQGIWWEKHNEPFTFKHSKRNSFFFVILKVYFWGKRLWLVYLFLLSFTL